MCGIALSVDPIQLDELVKLNTPRGARVHSVARINQDNVLTWLTKEPGPLESVSRAYEGLGSLVVTHQQAPTSEAGMLAHPANLMGKYLWHNGVVKQAQLDYFKLTTKLRSEWDTQLLLSAIDQNGDVPPIVDGSFACLLLSHNILWAFRNEIVPLYASDRSISSVPFEDAEELKAGWMYRVDQIPGGIDVIPVKEFELGHSPYFLGGD